MVKGPTEPRSFWFTPVFLPPAEPDSALEFQVDVDHWFQAAVLAEKADQAGRGVRIMNLVVGGTVVWRVAIFERPLGVEAPGRNGRC